MRQYKSPLFQHRHYAEIAAQIARLQLSDGARASLIDGFSNLFARDNANFQSHRFRAAAAGEPTNGKDKR